MKLLDEVVRDGLVLNQKSSRELRFYAISVEDFEPRDGRDAPSRPGGSGSSGLGAFGAFLAFFFGFVAAKPPLARPFAGRSRSVKASHLVIIALMRRWRELEPLPLAEWSLVL